MDLSKFPPLNASLNATSGLLLLLGYAFIRQRAMKAHAMCMVAACCTTILFLGCYIYYHAHHGSEPYKGTGPMRTVYFGILISHTILAITILPLVIRSLYLGLTGNFVKHSRVARVTFPLWLYVSVTGVIIYWMLYRL
ncbi:MAG TPA: DUF420 domain-containing protein [Verrucomicrobiae bacterium]|jgi:putative membrane protein|nr:DUF420 domain-containing protein [Verrucomicrobiae bacterium]